MGQVVVSWNTISFHLNVERGGDLRLLRELGEEMYE